MFQTNPEKATQLITEMGQAVQPFQNRGTLHTADRTTVAGNPTGITLIEQGESAISSLAQSWLRDMENLQHATNVFAAQDQELGKLFSKLN